MKEQIQGYAPEAPGLPQHVVIGEFLVSELRAPSGIFDEKTGTELTNLQAVELFESSIHGAQGVFLNSSQHLSPQGRARNTSVTRSSPYGAGRRGNYRVAVVSLRPPVGN